MKYVPILYISGSQPGVRVPLGVRQRPIGGTPEDHV
jgi:hypothetical protein